jgi:hypothetical protein
MMEDDLEESMMEADSMGDVQPLIKTSKRKRVFCPECVNKSFAKQSNLDRHKRDNHSDQTEDVVLKRQKVNAHQQENRAKNKKDPVKREKLRLDRKAYCEKVKAHNAANSMDVTQTTDEDEESKNEIGSSSRVVEAGDKVDCKAEEDDYESDHCLVIDEVEDEECKKKIGSISHAVKKGGKVDGKAEKAGDQSHHFLVIDEVEAEDFKKWIGSSSHAVKMGDNVDRKAEKACDESDDCLENYSNEGVRGRPLVVLEGGVLWWS